MRSAFALRIISGKIILNFAFVALCGALQTHFHGRGRKGKRHLQRRFLRKRGAAGKFFASFQRAEPSQSSLRDARFPLLSLRDIFPRSGGSLSSKGEPRARPEASSLHLKLQQRALDLGSPFGGAGAGAPERAIFPTEKGCLPNGRQPFPEENKENTHPKGRSEYQNMLSSL